MHISTQELQPVFNNYTLYYIKHDIPHKISLHVNYKCFASNKDVGLLSIQNSLTAERPAANSNLDGSSFDTLHDNQIKYTFRLEVNTTS